VLWLEWNFKSIEQIWHLTGESQKVPAQRMIDLHKKKVSSDIPKTSYVPGTSVRIGSEYFQVI
jgi:uncharacterized FAD-dependent dehydrogenase